MNTFLPFRNIFSVGDELGDERRFVWQLSMQRVQRVNAELLVVGRPEQRYVRSEQVWRQRCDAIAVRLREAAHRARVQRSRNHFAVSITSTDDAGKRRVARRSSVHLILAYETLCLRIDPLAISGASTQNACK